MDASRSQLWPLPVADVQIDDAFWTPRLETVRTSTLWAQLDKLRTVGHFDALKLTWKPGDQPEPHIFWESDVAKWIEAASYTLATHPDERLEGEVDAAIELLAGAQQEDGYLNTYFTVVKPGERFTDLRDAHELYCAGHLIEAGVAHYEATGKETLLNVVRRYADLIASEFGTLPDEKRGYDGHEEIELALVKLYRVTGESRYLDLATYFVDERGQEPYFFDLEEEQRGTPGYFARTFPDRRERPHRYREYLQAHAPVRGQTEAVGHSVRAMYLYSAMADLARENQDEGLLESCRTLWRHVTTKRMYATGGIGSSAANEGFTADYDLPDTEAYAETCAAIGLTFWAQRMALLDEDGTYADVLERALYNGVASGLSASGTRFFYSNPLASNGDVHRSEWFGVACCPPNIARLLASLGRYVYAAGPSQLVVNLYVGGSARVVLDGVPVTLSQKAAQPWDGGVELSMQVEERNNAEFTLALRIPEWAHGPSVTVNGEPVEVGALSRGYLKLTRSWSSGDKVSLDLPMMAHRVWAHPRLQSAAGRVALERGPLVYCLEETDHEAPLDEIFLPRDARLEADSAPVEGVVALRASAMRWAEQDWDDVLYRSEPPRVESVSVTAVPYFFWDNRQPGQMRVWLHDRG